MGYPPIRATLRGSFSRLVARTLRVLFFIVVAYGAIFWFASRSVKADVEQMLLSVGGEMMHYGRATHQDAPRTISLNGQTLKLSVGTTKDSLQEVLDHYERRCNLKDGGLSNELAEAYKQNGHQLSKGQKKLLGTIVRQDGGGKGFVVCLDAGTQKRHWKDWIAHLSRFVQSGNISEVGEIRYLYAERHKHTTTLVTLWADGALNVFHMFPNSGDAPGFDLPDVPRPKEAKRLLSAGEEGFSQSVHIYAANTMTGNQLFDFYHQALLTAGWRISVDPLRAKRPKHAPQVMIAQNSHRMLTIVTGNNRDGAGFVNIMNMH
ncbi:MAG: hypothetical protein H6715_00245 [Myxococcales bacterium]|nr:hypothetical protein [Myxococcales bacterium]MCB9707394.1 hypothetical protein [Myxococcales bacterium]